MTRARTYIIAEMAYSHDGSVALACEIVDKAAEAGADAISIHITHMPDYMVRHYGAGPGRVSAGKESQPIYDYLDEISLSFDQWREVASVARRRGLDLVVMPNDSASLHRACTLDPKAYVLSAACFEEHGFISEVGAAGRPVYLRVGGATLGEIETVIDLLQKAAVETIVLLYGHQSYPTSIEDTNLAFLSCLAATFGLPVGIADHVDAETDFALVAPLLALPLGATVIEKHLTHDRSKRGEDFESALNVDEFALLVERVRTAERAFGTATAVGLGDSAAQYRHNVRKRLVAARALPKGAVLDRTMIAAKRSDEGCFPTDLLRLVGRKVNRDVAEDEGLSLDMTAPPEMT